MMFQEEPFVEHDFLSKTPLSDTIPRWKDSQFEYDLVHGASFDKEHDYTRYTSGDQKNRQLGTIARFLYLDLTTA